MCGGGGRGRFVEEPVGLCLLTLPQQASPDPCPGQKTESAGTEASVLLHRALCLTAHAALRSVLPPPWEGSSSAGCRGGMRTPPEFGRSLPSAAVAGDHNPGGWKPFLRPRRSEVCAGLPGTHTEVWTAALPLDAGGRVCFLVFSSSWEQPACLAPAACCVFKVAPSVSLALSCVPLITPLSLTLALPPSLHLLVIPLGPHR